MGFLRWIKGVVFGANGFDQEENDKKVDEIKEEAREHWDAQKNASDETRISFESLRRPDR